MVLAKDKVTQSMSLCSLWLTAMNFFIHRQQLLDAVTDRN